MATVIYLAAPWALREEARRVRDHFVANGISVNSRWLDRPDDGEWNPDVLENEACHDLEDICAADGMVVLHYKISEGKSFEQGFFLGISGALNKRNKIIVVIPDDFGRSHNVFHYIKDVYDKVSTVDEAINLVKTWKK